MAGFRPGLKAWGRFPALQQSVCDPEQVTEVVTLVPILFYLSPPPHTYLFPGSSGHRHFHTPMHSVCKTMAVILV